MVETKLTDDYVSGYIIRVSDTNVLCWVKLTPNSEYHIKISIEKVSFDKNIKLIPGVRFDWSPSLGTVRVTK